jgi:hypothetical protein
MQNGIVTAPLLHRLTQINGVQTVLATVKSGAKPEAVARLAGERLAAQFPTAKLQSNASSRHRSAIRSINCCN